MPQVAFRSYLVPTRIFQSQNLCIDLSRQIEKWQFSPFQPLNRNIYIGVIHVLLQYIDLKMHGIIVGSKMTKCKQNINSYLNSGSGQNRRNDYNQNFSRTTSQSYTQQAIQNNTNNSQSAIKNSSKNFQKNQIELETVNYGFKSYESGQMVMKYSKENGNIFIEFNDEENRKRIEIKRDDLKGKQRIEYDLKSGRIGFIPKFLLLTRRDTKQNNKNNNQWITEKKQKDTLFNVTAKDREQLRAFKQSTFCEGLFDPESTSNYLETVRPMGDVQTQGAQEQDHVNPKFSFPTPEKLAQTDKLRRTIRDMKEEDKITVLMDIFKIKKQYDDPLGFNKKLKCPISRCGKTYREIQQLKTHLKTKHPELTKHGIQLIDYDGSFEFSHKALDLALYLGKIEPFEIKKVVKQMKTKNPE